MYGYAHYNLADVIVSIHKETMANIAEYAAFFRNENSATLLRYMDKYLYQYLYISIYNTRFGDLVPIILANAFQLNLILSKGVNSTDMQKVKVECRSPDTSRYVVLQKCPDHYNGIVKKQFPSVVAIRHEDDFCKLSLSNDYRVQRNVILHNEHADPTYSSGDNVNKILPDQSSHTHSSAIKRHERADMHGPDYTNPNRALNICSWNINGPTQTNLSDDVLGKFLTKFDIILLSETWSSEGDNFELCGYTFYNYPRQLRNQKAKRGSGGLGIFVWNDIANVVTCVKYTKDIIAWIKLDKDYFGLETETYIANIYCVPAGSTYPIDDPFDILLHDLSQLPGPWQILVCGDYNTRTGTVNDYMIHDISGSNGDLERLLLPNDIGRTANAKDETIIGMHSLNLLNRYSEDKSPINSHGKRLIELCITCRLLVLSGRLGSDKGIGAFTRIDTTGTSVVDYTIGSPQLFAISSNFFIHGKFPE